MTELADIFQRYGPAYRSKFGERLLPSHRQAMRAIEQCRTQVLGGQVYQCDQCAETRYSYHSCRNRHCPKCQAHTGQQWLNNQRDLLLPVPYFMLTFTLPAQLRALTRRQQRLMVNLLFRASAAATQQLARNPRWLGGQIGLIGVLHTWSRDLVYHPHVHYLAPGGALTDQGQWRPARNFFLPVKALSILFRAKFRDALKKTALYDQIPAETWDQPWVVHAQPVGRALPALNYLARYLFRVALGNNRILKVNQDRVTFRTKTNDTGQGRTCTLAAEEFMRRFLQHVLPKGLVKVRYYGFLSPGQRHRLQQLRQCLAPVTSPPPAVQPLTSATSTPAVQGRSLCCPTCGQTMRWVQSLRPQGRCPPAATTWAA